MGRLLDIIGYSQGKKSRVALDTPKAIAPKKQSSPERQRWIEWRCQLGMRKSDAIRAYDDLQQQLRQPQDEPPVRGRARLRQLIAASKKQALRDAEQKARESRKTINRRKYQRRHSQPSE